MSHPNRLRLLTLLVSTQESMEAGRLAILLGLKKSTFSSHIALLVRAGLIFGQRDGRRIRYHLDDFALRQTLNTLESRLLTTRKRKKGPVA